MADGYEQEDEQEYDSQAIPESTPATADNLVNNILALSDSVELPISDDDAQILQIHFDQNPTIVAILHSVIEALLYDDSQYIDEGYYEDEQPELPAVVQNEPPKKVVPQNNSNTPVTSPVVNTATVTATTTNPATPTTVSTPPAPITTTASNNNANTKVKVEEIKEIKENKEKEIKETKEIKENRVIKETTDIKEKEKIGWLYKDADGKIKGPVPQEKLERWHQSKAISSGVLVKLSSEGNDVEFVPLCDRDDFWQKTADVPVTATTKHFAGPTNTAPASAPIFTPVATVSAGPTQKNEKQIPIPASTTTADTTTEPKKSWYALAEEEEEQTNPAGPVQYKSNKNSRPYDNRNENYRYNNYSRGRRGGGGRGYRSNQYNDYNDYQYNNYENYDYNNNNNNSGGNSSNNNFIDHDWNAGREATHEENSRRVVHDRHDRDADRNQEPSRHVVEAAREDVIKKANVGSNLISKAFQNINVSVKVKDTKNLAPTDLRHEINKTRQENS